ncbi:hypothetical protein Hypma_005331 [Hypsizygus marmoreus]|uniref:Protein kinase domain-containing protein n=1 Tax=Hypsizygus marmoreus TaxID=39966 RepID=A0A369K1Y9_HYPMA|nr:hypothetical protein Hypma_005331 [Hypsizygus marmoreus]
MQVYYRAITKKCIQSPAYAAQPAMTALIPQRRIYLTLSHDFFLSLTKHHPYLPGSRLDLQFTPKFGGAGQFCILSVDIIKAFEPFTSAVVLLVRPRSQIEADTLGLPSQFVAKITDRRHTIREDIPAWSASFEKHFTTAVEHALRANPMPDSFTSLHGTSTDPEGPEEDWIREIRLCEFRKECFNKEVAVYRHLRVLQGCDIPYFYGTFRLPIASKISGPMHENDVVASILEYAEGMALEYIDGLNLAEVQLDADFPRAVVERASEKTLQIMNRLHNLGAWHGDPRPHNVIIRRKAPRDPVLIDFGLSKTKSPETSIEEWKNGFHPGVDQVTDMRYALAHAGMHIESPELIAPDKLDGYRYINRWLESRSKEWREQFFDPVPVAEPGYKLVVVDGEQGFWQFARWKLKPGVKTIGDHRYN